MKIIKLTESDLLNMIKKSLPENFKSKLKRKKKIIEVMLEEYLVSSSPNNWEDEFDFATDVIYEIIDMLVLEYEEMYEYYDELIDYMKTNYSDKIFQYYSKNHDNHLNENNVMNENYYKSDKLYDREYIISILKKAPRHLKSIYEKLDDIPCKNSKGESRRCTKIPEVLHTYMWDR